MTKELALRYRVSAREKDDVRRFLAFAYGEQRLDDDALEDRLCQVNRATYSDELARIVNDLPSPKPRMRWVHRVVPRGAYRYGVAFTLSATVAWLGATWGYLSAAGSLGAYAGTAIGIIGALAGVISIVGLCAKHVHL